MRFDIKLTYDGVAAPKRPYVIKKPKNKISAQLNVNVKDILLIAALNFELITLGNLYNILHFHSQNLFYLALFLNEISELNISS